MKNRIANIKQLAASLLRKPQSWSKKQQLIAGLALVFALMGLAGGAAWADHASGVRAANELSKRQEDARLAEVRRTALEQEQAKQQRKGDQKAEVQVQQPSSTTKKEVTKYSTSSDPRSTDYSTTPPAPNPASFSIRITYAGQLSRGDMMFYNATKGEKGYYGGDLKLSPAIVTVSRSGQGTAPVTVSSYDGGLISMPSMPWDDQNPHFSIVYPSANPPSGVSSYGMVVDTYNMPPVGTYKLHIFSGCGGFGYDSCESHGFIKVNVVE